MFTEFVNDKHQVQVDEFISELGRFVLAFEKVCDVMRYLVMFMLRSQGLKNQGIEQIIVGDKAAAELQVLLGAIFCQIAKHDEADKRCVKDLLTKFKGIVEKRNVLLHSSWNLGAEPADEELYAATVRFRAKQNGGSSAEVHGYSASYIRDLSGQLKHIQVLLQRLQYCVMQNGFKVSTELEKPI